MTTYRSQVGDLLWRNMLSDAREFQMASRAKTNYPVDIYEDDMGVHFEFAVINTSKDDIEITVDNKTLKVSHMTDDNEPSSDRKYISRGISKKKFDLAWEISPAFDLSKLEANMANGMLIIDIPYSEDAAPKKVMIK